MKKQPTLIDTTQAAKMLQCSTEKIRQLWKDGVIEGIDINPLGHRPTIRIFKDSVLKAINQQPEGIYYQADLFSPKKQKETT